MIQSVVFDCRIAGRDGHLWPQALVRGLSERSACERHGRRNMTYQTLTFIAALSGIHLGRNVFRTLFASVQIGF